jgi:hypothetical protein
MIAPATKSWNLVGRLFRARVGGERPGLASLHAGLRLAAPPRRVGAERLPPGTVLYLSSFVVVAVVTVGIFFGLGLFLLAHNSADEARASESSARIAAVFLPMAATPLWTSATVLAPGVSAAQATTLREKVGGSLPLASPNGAPAAASATPAASSGLPGGPEAGGAPKPAAPSAVASRSEPTSDSLTGSAAHETILHLPAAEITALLARGNSFFRNGDIASARLFYQRAADAGDARAALRMGETYDPAFLGRGRRRGVRGDQAEARLWYGLALGLGAPEAERRLTRLEKRSSR